ncbi:glycoside hydrolase family 15 protein [Amantichitinum ursilacus]|uniref:Trehalase n=1 Tax=Amantichitinum ursilacus TaxID=857265 RepID=A0A0N0XJ63_9NEIS|nr:glycoside hydrolase family 15 protein [Amantichitinum ursilacus]KPC51914.1 Trehalase [Amantichitinum ursilacus]
MPSRIEDYALLGDCETAALVSKAGSIDWLCWPRFDSSACFAALLGNDDHGCWRIAPVDGQFVQRAYRPGTLILDTEFSTATGRVRITDFMPLRDEHSHLIRLVEGLEGEVEMELLLRLRFDMGLTVPWVRQLPEADGIHAVAGPDMVVLRTPIELDGVDLSTVARFKVSAGQVVPFTLSYGPSHLDVPPGIDVNHALAHCEQEWRQWSDRCLHVGPFAETVKRSLITLKALTYAPTGAIIAAATTSLPEALGGVRNWDYRFCWLRDATLTVMTLLRAGYVEEAAAWRSWLVRAVAGTADQIQIMYGIAGERMLDEKEIPWLPGYANSAPVRIGNQAATQLQLDTYGELMDALYQARRGGLAADDDAWSLQCNLLERLERIWQQPDEGIWEVRGGAQQFTSSKMMAWVAVDRCIKTAEQFDMKGPVEHWKQLRDQMHADVCAQGFNAELNSFVQVYGGDQLDASLLGLALVGFLPPDDPRIIGTVAAVEKYLLQDGLVLRYRTAESRDGLPPGEGAFLACSFWLADNWVLQGRMEEASALYEHLLSLRNDLGLLSEEYDPVGKQMLGNFPQAFSHMSIVFTAYGLTGDGPMVGERAS